MSHWSSAPRRGYVIAHHTASNYYDTTEPFCPYGYDFFIRYTGQLVVCPSWSYAFNNHATGCGCNTIGVAWVGCFGGAWCDQNSFYQGGPSWSQKCMMAYVLSHLNTPTSTSRLRPHRNCYYWNPCSASPGTTVCCGTRFTTTSTTNYNWNSAGVGLRDEVRNMRVSWDNYACCNGPSGAGCVS